MAQNRKVVLGLGNLLNRDEGLGVQALKLLDAQLGQQTQFELLDGGVLGLNLLMIVEECSHLLILDAVNVGRPAGTVVNCAKRRFPSIPGSSSRSTRSRFKKCWG